MYSAIVFLPLIGAILAGVIALAGAGARHRGGETPLGHEDDATDPQGGAAGDYAASAHVPRHAAAIPVAHHEAHGEEAHHQPAQGSRAAELITSGLLVISALLSWVSFFQVALGSSEGQIVPVLTWIHSGNLVADWTLRI